MEIVDRHGFTNDKLFNRMFKEIYGATPREIRRRLSRMM
jgi:AraC-like DNA-binding protein